MFWIILIIIVGIIYVLYNVLKNGEKQESPMPPNEDVTILGCNGDCGYWSPEFYTKSDGTLEMNAKKCYCAYKKQWVKEFSECPFAKEHPELLRPSVFASMDFDD